MMPEDSEEVVAGRSHWWLDGQEYCQFCCHRYVLEMEQRCIGCDLPVCPLCVITVRETLETYCPHCHPGSTDPSE